MFLKNNSDENLSTINQKCLRFVFNLQFKKFSTTILLRNEKKNHHVIYQLQIIQSDAFTKPCNASLQTLKFVSKCPNDKASFETASNQKNCTAFNTHGQICQSFQYHCVLSDDLKHIVEVCAPSIYIIGKYLAIFSFLNFTYLKIHMQLKHSTTLDGIK